MAEKEAMAASDHDDELLVVYPSRTTDDSWWCATYGDLKAPQGWEFLPRGDAFITRQVKRLGLYWVVVRKRKDYTEPLGLLAPATSIEAARALASETASRREVTRAVSRERREKQEQIYRQQFAEAVIRFLEFAPRYRALARKIAEGVAEHATEVGSDRVGRTAKLSLEEKAELAARAYIRHHHTKYEERLLRVGLFEPSHDDPIYRDLRQEAHEEVNEFLERHRRPGRRSSRGSPEDAS